MKLLVKRIKGSLPSLLAAQQLRARKGRRTLKTLLKRIDKAKNAC